MLAASAVAQVQAAATTASPGKKSDSEQAPRSGKAKTASRCEKDTPRKPQQPATAPRQIAPPVSDDPNVDLAYGAYQRGQYKTAFDLATARAGEWRSEGDDDAR